MSVVVYSPYSKVGTIHETGQIFDNDGLKLGHIFPSGELRDSRGFLMGRAFPSGIQSSNPILGQISRNQANQIVFNGDVIGRMQVGWGNRIPVEQAMFAAGYLLMHASGHVSA